MSLTFKFGYYAVPVVQNQLTSLDELTHRLIRSLQPTALQNENLIVNDLTGDFFVAMKEHNLSNVMTMLLTRIIKKSKNCCIRLSAKVFNDITLFQVKTNHIGETADPPVVEDVRALAGQMGTNITVNDFRSNSISYTFSLSNYSQAA